ncbi:MAG TPA: undecaprenyldiphospho-muramoylpentapeptide beta-N-acetylglucosaminyltransferase [Treponemataceae bacterium]|nr:undecaprenyldiphospho-muramoylpentapeptide beta-N-acetylglucosaminyltransferase [Treponemataceae bacterium]
MSLIVFTGGGTGGHIFPGLAIIDELIATKNVDILWIGSSKGVDRDIITSHGTEFIGIPSGKLRRYFSFHNFVDVFRIFFGFISSLVILSFNRPILVFSKGGFVSVPPCLAAKILRIPVITHECDYSPGLATKINARSALKILVSCEETLQYFSPSMRNKVLVTGNPVRTRFYDADALAGRAFIGLQDTELPILLVLGGSLGAHQVNEIILDCLDTLCASFFVVHQTGPKNADLYPMPEKELTKSRYIRYPFIRDEMADVLAASSLVIARSGANTVWECAAAGKPMILIPLEKGNSRGDQVENARFFVSRGAALMLSGENANSQCLIETLHKLNEKPQVLKDMAANAAALGMTRPAKIIADILASYVDGSQ